MKLASIRAWIFGHKLVSGIILVGLATGGFYGYRALFPAAVTTTYTLAAVERGALISSVSASGQVSASDQLDVKSKVSGDVLAAGLTIGQSVKAGDVLVKLDDTDARKTVRDALSSYESARLSLEKLKAPADELSLTQSENSLNQAQRSLTQAESNYSQLVATTAQTAATAYEDGYNSASDAFLDMPNHTKDLRDLRGSDVNPDANVSSFQNILGHDSPLIAIWLRDHDAAIAIYNESFTFFKTVPRTSDDAALYDLIDRTLQTEKALSQALQSAHAMLDAVVNTTYSPYSIASTVNTMRPKITADISQINSDITATQKAKDTLDATKRDGPINMKKAQDTIDAAKESLRQATQSLAKLNAGADPLDIRSQELSVTQRYNALVDAQQKLPDYVIKAPFDGTVAAYDLKRGDSVSANAAVATLVTSKRYADVTLNEVDAVKVKTGQKATLTFDAIDGLSISAEVASIDVLGTVSQGVVNYGVRLQFDTQDERVKPGMSVAASIVTDIKTDVLLAPSAAVKADGDASYVEVFNEAGLANQKTVVTAAAPSRQTVEVGASNDSSTEIISGVKEGQLIVTRSAKTGTATTTSKSSSSNSLRIPGLGGGGQPGR